MNELNSGFSRHSDSQLNEKAGHIIMSLTDNVSFPTPSPTLASVQGALDNYQQALAGEKTSANRQLRKSMREALTTILQQLAADLELAANGDLVKLSTTGFDLRKAPVHHEGPTPIPQNLRVKTTGTSGEALCKCKPDPQADGYEGEYALEPNSGPWISAGSFTNSQKLLFTGLTRGKDYYFRIRAVGTNGKSGWSDVATMMVV